MDISHLKNEELEPTFQKYKERVVLRGDIVKDDSGAYAVFTEQGLSASQMTPAKQWMLLQDYQVARSPTSSVCFNRFTARLASERSFTTARDTEPCNVEAVRASSGRHCRAIQDRENATARSAFTSPSDASALLSKHRPVVMKLVVVSQG